MFTGRSALRQTTFMPTGSTRVGRIDAISVWRLRQLLRLTPHRQYPRGPAGRGFHLRAPTNTVAPLGGTFPRFATHSTAHLPAPATACEPGSPSRRRCRSRAYPPASPATWRSLSRNSAAAFEKPGKCSAFAASVPRNAFASPAFASHPLFRHTAQPFGIRPWAFSHAFRSSTLTAASASFFTRSRMSMTTAGATNEAGSIFSAVMPLASSAPGRRGACRGARRCPSGSSRSRSSRTCPCSSA